jgi:hypothetical protein
MDVPPSLRVIDSSAEHLLLEFTLPALRVQALEIDGGTYHLLEIEGGAVKGRSGEPMLPTFSRLIRIPDRAGVSFEVSVVTTTEFPRIRPLPMQPGESEESEESEQLGQHEEPEQRGWSEQPERSGRLLISREAYARSGYPASEPVRVGDPAIARDLRVVPITFSPVRYDPARETIEVASRIRVRVTFAGMDLRNAKQRHARVIPRSFDRLYRNLVVNYEGPREDQAVSLGTYVIICPDDPSVISALDPLVEWRTRKGYEVHLATTAETGSSREEIKNWLQNAYDTWENPPEFISLVGDANGSIAIPCWTYSSGETDHPYVQLEGGDVLADAHVGRISVDGPDQLQLYVTKIVGYESTPYMEETDWYTRACLVGDAGVSGITCVQIMQWLKLRLLEYGYAEVDTIFSSPWVSQMIAALNEGDTVFSYRGYWGHSGWTNGNVEALMNGWMMPFALSITCGTGSFAGGTSISEAWMRAGLPPDRPTGGIASVATATLGTHTRYNNCITYGVWRGIFWEELYTFGQALTRGKYELYVNYWAGDPSACQRFTHWNNLMGDAAGEIWTGVPQPLEVVHPSNIPLGTTSITTSVATGGSPVAGAYVCLWDGVQTHVGGYTNTAGTVELPVRAVTAGDMRITVTKHDHHPYLTAISIDHADCFVGYFAHMIDDDTSGSSSGNGDGQPNPTEHIEVPVWVRNYGTEPAYEVGGTLTTDDPYVTILDESEDFGDILSGGSAWSEDDFDIAIDGGAPNGHVIRLGLDLQSGTDSWHSLIEIPVRAAQFVYDDVTLYDMGSQVDPGEEGEISVRIRNVGDASATSVTGTLVSGSSWVTVTDAQGAFGDIGVAATGDNTEDRFAISVLGTCPPGHIAPLTIHLEFSGGALDTMDFVLPVGTAGSQDPTGPDAYGYCAFDNTDTAYDQVPTYEWIEIAPHHGGPGIDVGLVDNGGGMDDSEVVDLPFPFVFYGQTFTRATICSNGWIAMGATYLENRRNWNIPAAGAPPYLIAPMWDNLYQYWENRVYHWYDETNHRYVVEWSDVRNNYGGALENFEVVLYDPAHYPTASGDGEIVFQYDTFNNSDILQHYSTVGIQNGDQTDGLMYSYFNLYNAGAAAIGTGRAIKFIPVFPGPHGMLTGTVTNASNGHTPLAQATVRVVNGDQLFSTGPDGAYQGAVSVGVHTVIATHPSFAPDTASSVWIIEGETTVLDFSLADNLPPAFSGTTDYPNTGDGEGPYEICSTVIEYSEFEQLALLYNVNGAGWTEIPLTELGDNRYHAAISGQPYGSLIKYHLSGRDVAGNAATDPANAPWENYEFRVIEPLLADDMEDGPTQWIHYAVTDGFTDQWHHSEERNHTGDGSWSWKLGAEGGGYYANHVDGALETAAIPFAENATLTFWHWIDAQISGSYPGYAYDGGIVEISIDGGPWTQITPVGGYTYLIRHGSNPGPFPPDTPVFSGSSDWREEEFELAGITGLVRLRFRFGSDGSATGEGWYIDDVLILPTGPGVSQADDERQLPRTVALYQNNPNPFDGLGTETHIRFDLPRASDVRLQIFDASGRLVRTLIKGALPAGRHTFPWNGRDGRAHPVASGIYFYVLEAAHGEHSKRMLILK